ncbi:potassium channel family protein [Gordonia sp. PKS22-38]|uniref:Potassium channel family protein n=1 Tax=Gordonia prachuapensis TaxID=3115651 RepID=A0ABU7MSN8_9ACTN|nr:potassium channel family protein [Gordonia sp. PKS22-38]
MALLFLAAYSVQVLANPSDTVDTILDVVIFASWVCFAIDYVVRLSVAPHRGSWFIRHLADLAIVVLPMLRPLRLLRLLILVGVLQKALGSAIRGRVVLYTAASAMLLIYVASLAIYETEGQLPDATITSFGDAVWWSMTTVTTVGYGDYSPITLTGRVIAGFLMLGGISVIGVVTATIASWIVQRVADDDEANSAATSAELQLLRAEVADLRRDLARHREAAEV